MMQQIKISTTGGKNDWKANVGQVTIDMLSKKKIDGELRVKIIDQSVDILESCGNPQNESNNLTGLVIGYVQSGKTLSFTTVSALAAENGYNVIIVIAGTGTALVNQTHSRLADDLDIHISSEVSWKTFVNPTSDSRTEINGDLEPGILNSNPVLLITVMKNVAHLKNLNQLFRTGVDTKKCKVLIIDDEADQASLNTKASKKEESDVSTIYYLISKLKQTFANHTYLQYTATPQAPLFISLLDILSPSFVKILTPGDDYTGGKAFFNRNQQSFYPHIYEVPEDEIYTDKNPINQIPESLVEATMFYYLTVVIGALKGERAQNHNRTMMVHPSQLTLIHAVYERWLVKLKKRLIQELLLPDSDRDKIDLVNKFRAIYEEIPSNLVSLPSFEDVLKHLEYVVRVTPIFLSNSNAKNKVDFKRYYSMILVGGQVLDRGFTVEGLNVTYMPRSVGVGNADTLQQRCRFFGYKKKYLDLCRIYLPRRSKRAYIDYVIHEEDVRNKLDQLDKQSKPLKEFKRMFILSSDLNITRKNVISDDLRRYRLKGWRAIQFVDPNITDNNFIYEQFIEFIDWKDLLPIDSQATDIQKHEDSIISTADLVDKLLLSLQHMDAANTLLINHFLSLLSILMEGGESQSIYLVNMSKGLARLRSVDGQNKIKNVFQGANAKTNYLGDRSIISENLITVQFHNIEVKELNEKFRTIAIHIPSDFGQDIITLDNN